MPLPPMYHFTRSPAACAAVDQGLAAAVTPHDPLQAVGVWVSPNRYGSGSPGSFFGPIGLRVADAFVAHYRCVYVGLKPQTANRHRFLLLPPGAALPAGVTQRPAPAGYPDAERTCELLLMADVPRDQIDGLFFGEERGVPSEDSQIEHARFFAHLLRNTHPLLGSIRDPHSTVWSIFGGWWIFNDVRRTLVGTAGANGRGATAPDIEAALEQFAAVGSAGCIVLQGVSSASVRDRVTEAYATAYRAVTGRPLDLSDDEP